MFRVNLRPASGDTQTKRPLSRGNWSRKCFEGVEEPATVFGLCGDSSWGLEKARDD